MAKAHVCHGEGIVRIAAQPAEVLGSVELGQVVNIEMAHLGPAGYQQIARALLDRVRYILEDDHRGIDIDSMRCPGWLAECC